MKNFIFLLISWVFIGSFVVQHVAAQQVLNLATLDDFRPFTWKENNLSKGIDADIIKEMCQRMDVKCNIQFYPWKRVLKHTEIGISDGGFSAFKTSTREKFAYFLEYPIHYSTYNVFVKKGHEFPFKKIVDLYGKTIGINRGFKLSKEFDEAVDTKKIQVEEVDSMAQNIKKLMVDRIQGIAANYHETLVLLKKMELSDKVVALPNPIVSPKGAYLMISKEAEITDKIQIIEKMNRILKIMHEDGTINQINNKHLQ